MTPDPFEMTPERFDIAIVGSGPVGLALAWRLRGSGLRIAVVEAGGRKHLPADEAQTLAATRKTPPGHPEAHMYRRRMLGGASTVWGGRCLHYDEIDFLPNGNRIGWPIAKGDVDPHIGPALEFLEAGENLYDETAFDLQQVWGEAEAGVDFDRIERFSPPTDVWSRYGAELRAAGITVLHDTVVTGIALDAASGRATGLALRAALTDAEARLDAGRVILAGGGIETARLLLSSRALRPEGLGNARDLVGRHYMTHLIGDIGTLHYAPEVSDEKLDYRLTSDGVYARSVMRLSERTRAEAGLPSILWRPNIPPVWDPSHRNAILSAMHFAKRLAQREYAERLDKQGGGAGAGSRGGMLRHGRNILADPLTLAGFARTWIGKRILARRKLPSVFLRHPERRYPMEMNAEQYPDPASRIALSDRLDRHGMPLITLDWRAGKGTIEGIAASLAILRDRVMRSGIGRFDFDPEAIADHLVPQGGHHIGTARMGATPETGVVDRDGALFDCPNVHVAGSAVFPTSGCVNPTLLAVALAFRLGEHILELEKKA
ncbi:GMC oxidoreductase [Pseudogemmobacter sonorensis]|uniref:GMC oxidoreductase n=1 Tax=Pseudogemmobacter sonorensis TaxID=2989681 RepID=UPI00369E1408